MSTDKCQLCSKLGASESPKYSTLDVRKTHAQFHLFQLGYIGDDNIALRRVFEQCFLTTEMFVNRQMEVANGNNEEENGEKSRWTLLELCRTLIQNREGSSSLFCRVCKSEVQYVQVHSTNGSSYLDAKTLLNHAITHSVTRPYQCPYCEYGSTDKSNVARHIKQMHASSVDEGDRDDVQEHWSVNFDEIVTSLGKCFEQFDPAATIGSAMRYQQSARCSELLKAYANNEKKLRCILCRKWISTGGRALDAMKHIHHVHLNKPIFKCKKCSKMFKSSDGVRYHVTSRHKNSSTKNFVQDISDKYHAEIMKLVSKCFDMKSKS